MYVGYSTVPGSSEPYNFWSDTSGKFSLRAVLIRSHLLPGWVLKRKRRGRRSDFQTSSSFFLSRISALQLAGGSWWSYFEKNKKATVECCERKQRRQFSSAQLQIFFANVYDFYVKLIFRVGRFFCLQNSRH